MRTAIENVVFKNCAAFSGCKTEVNEVFIDEANYIYIAMPMYNLIEYSDNYSDTSGDLWQFKRDEVPKIIMLIWLLIIFNQLNIKQLLQEKQQMLLIII